MEVKGRIFLKTFIVLRFLQVLSRITNSVELSASFACEILLSYEGLLKVLVHMCVCVCACYVYVSIF